MGIAKQESIFCDRQRHFAQAMYLTHAMHPLNAFDELPTIGENQGRGLSSERRALPGCFRTPSDVDS